jgi:hypothetical protein
MKKNILILSGFVTMLLVLPSVQARSQFGLDIESGYLSTGYNDIRIPGDGGTFFSLSEELEAHSKVFLRLRLNYKPGIRHTISLLYAPLTVLSDGSVGRDILYEGVNFPANSNIKASYKFNSYRITYRYDIVQKPKLDFGLGFTAKIRDAKIDLTSGELYGEKVNVGFVPIINFRLHYKPYEKLGLLFEGDALAAPQGRAEDVLLAATYKVSDHLILRAGYRILEGGADNDEVYTFSLFHYGSVGLNISF